MREGARGSDSGSAGDCRDGEGQWQTCWFNLHNSPTFSYGPSEKLNTHPDLGSQFLFEEQLTIVTGNTFLNFVLCISYA